MEKLKPLREVLAPLEAADGRRRQTPAEQRAALRTIAATIGVPLRVRES